MSATPGRADLSALSDEQLCASTVIHKACVAVDEQGTEAAAATAVPLPRSFDPRQKVPFVVDRPSWFLVRDRRTGSWLFLGRVEDPAEQPSPWARFANESAPRHEPPLETSRPTASVSSVSLKFDRYRIVEVQQLPKRLRGAIGADDEGRVEMVDILSGE